MPKKTIPTFRSDAEEAEFWETHSFADYIDATEPAPDVHYRPPNLRQISLRLSPTHIEGLKRIAAQKGIGYQTLLRMWIAERLHEEKAA